MTQRSALPAVLAVCLFAGWPPPASPCHMPQHLRRIEHRLTPAQLAMMSHGAEQAHQIPYSIGSAQACVGGMADIFPCQRVDLLAHRNLSEIGGGSGNDIWGWVDPLNQREYALVGRSTGTAFVDVTDPEDPVYLGDLPTHDDSSSWRDVQVYENYAFVVADFAGDHGMQIFDLTQLRNVPSPPVTFAATAHYPGFERAHNVAINEATGFAYAVGSETCDGGLHMIDVSEPTAPVFRGCFAADGYTHDVQCVVYQGPDAEHQGDEICFASNEDTITIVDVTDKANPVQLSRTGYDDSGYTHQGWLTGDQRYFVHDDELDEVQNGHTTYTYVWDVSDLEAPELSGHFAAAGSSIDHNQFIHGDHTYQANYRRGLRILHLDDPATADLSEVAFFDTYPEADGNAFNGAWGVYPFFPSGTVVVSDINRGLFVLRPNLCTAPAAPAGLAAAAAGDNQIELTWSGGGPGETFNVYRAPGACPGGVAERIAGGVAGSPYLDAGVSGQVEFAYTVTASDPSGLCESPASACASAVTTGPCTAAPSFGGVEGVTSPGFATCTLELDWSAATALCGPGVTYSVYRDTDPAFVPSPANLVAAGVTASGFTDTQVASGVAYTYVVRAVDTGNGSEDGNLVRVTGAPIGPIGDGTFAAGAEAGDPPFSFEGTGSGGGGWQLSDERVHGGEQGYFSSYPSSACLALVSPPLELTAGQSPALSFWTVFDVESGFDGGVVEVSADGGETWSPLALTPAYPGAFGSSSDSCGYPIGRPAFTGTDLTWGQHGANLTPWAGSEILVRWIFSTDELITQEGWYVDDVAVTHAQVPGACESGGNEIFDDGFESGDVSAWSGSNP